MKHSITQRLQAQPEALTHLLFGLTNEQVISRLLPDKWSIYENLVHLARYHEIFRQRITLILEGTMPVFQAYKADDDEGFYAWQKKSYQEVRNDFEQDRKDLNAFLLSLDSEQLKLTGRHAVYGLTMNIEGWTEFFLLHEAHHFLTILKLTAKLGNERIFGLGE